MNPGRRKAGVRQAEFDALYQRHSREVWAMAYARWMDADTALDVTQDVFPGLGKQWENGKKIVNPRAWLPRAPPTRGEVLAKISFRRTGTPPPQLMNGVKSHEPLPLES